MQRLALALTGGLFVVAITVLVWRANAPWPLLQASYVAAQPSRPAEPRTARGTGPAVVGSAAAATVVAPPRPDAAPAVAPPAPAAADTAAPLPAAGTAPAPSAPAAPPPAAADGPAAAPAADAPVAPAAPIAAPSAPPAAAPPATTPPAATPPAERPVVDGRCMCAGSPVAGLQLELARLADAGEPQRATTDAEGHFQFTAAGGEYELRAAGAAVSARQRPWPARV